jgi:hypothetical protein
MVAAVALVELVLQTLMDLLEQMVVAAAAALQVTTLLDQEALEIKEATAVVLFAFLTPQVRVAVVVVLVQMLIMVAEIIRGLLVMAETQ